MIDSTFTYNGCKPVYTCGNITVSLTSLACRDMASEHKNRKVTSHMDDTIIMVMFTIEATSSHVMIGCGVVDLDHVSLNNQRDVEFSGISCSNLIIDEPILS